MRKGLFLAILLGLLLGIAQIFYVRDKTIQKVEVITPSACLAISPECGYCPGTEKDGLCYSDEYTQKFRGWPLSNGSYGVNSTTDINARTYANIPILVALSVGSYLTVSLVVKYVKKIR